MTRAVHHAALGLIAVALAVAAGLRAEGRWDQITAIGLPLWVSLLTLLLIGLAGLLSPAHFACRQRRHPRNQRTGR